MKVLIPTIGSRGDVQLYINLGVELSNAGFDITIATHPYWRNTIESFDLSFIPLGPDVNLDMEAANVKRSFNIFAILKMLNNIHQMASSKIIEILPEFDLLIVSHMLCGAMEAMKLDKQYISVTLVPQIVPEIKSGEKTKKKYHQSLLNSFYFYFGPWSKISKKLGLKNVTQFHQLHSPDLNLLPISSHIYPQNAGWNKNHIVTGIWQLPSQNHDIPAVLREFLQKYENPIIVALGAMSFDTENDRDKVQTIINAITKTGNSGIIQGFSNSIRKLVLPESMLHLESFPHDILFKFGKLIIHHCGFGTMTTSLFCGKPSIVIPHILDQFFWADRLYELGLCPKPVPARRLTEKNLIDSIHTCSNTPEILRNTIKMMEKLKMENGAKKARELIEIFVKDKLR